MPTNFLSDSLKILDAGCGTGHYTCTLGKTFANSKIIGIDLSESSLSIGRKLAKKHNIKNVQFINGNYNGKILKENGPFDLIVAIGTVHHNPNPSKTLKALANSLKPNGFLCLHLYGKRIDQGKFDIKNILNLISTRKESINEKFKLYKELMEFQKKRRPFWKKLLMISIYDIFVFLGTNTRNLIRKIKKISWSPAWNNKYFSPTSPWVDHFCHPLENAYEADEVIDIINSSGLKIYNCIGLGKFIKNNIPEKWINKYKKLSLNDQIRLNELLLYIRAINLIMEDLTILF